MRIKKGVCARTGLLFYTVNGSAVYWQNIFQDSSWFLVKKKKTFGRLIKNYIRTPDLYKRKKQ